ncbi:Hypothetical protein C900_01435 [Fulvivirga imtechensis AK7]|uniref:DUF58 domain-containing protein n=1 Tax=Fulvivirga imtechensis AK7 TaxID=1237149 RepID=L8JYH3_9BACT|nr:DUF58 domain-containing protein [Fulvivirga imtechensis]ELR73825.1 Hypothetical protein C900_01435 [Fulvivirga imtechensis AK7]
MKQDYHDLLKPEIVNSVSGLALIARVIVEGYLSGMNRSTKVGTGMEFSQYRGYEPGDDLRLLDWKMLARSGRYYIKQSEIETNISIKFILDASASMEHREDRLSKMDYARVLVASLAYLGQTQGDAIGLFAVNQNEVYSLYPKVQKQHYNRLLYELIHIKNKGKWPVNPASFEKLHDRRHKELIFFITDMYEYEQELSRVVASLKNSRNEVVVLHIMGEKESRFTYEGAVTFEEIETGRKVKVDAKEAKTTYLKALDNRIAGIKAGFLAKNISHELFLMNGPIAETLNLFLKKRIALL